MSRRLAVLWSVEEVRLPSKSTRGKQRISVALEDMLETMAPLLPLPKACALHELVAAVLRRELQLTGHAFQMTVQIILQEHIAVLHCLVAWMNLLAPELVAPCMAAPAA